MASTQVKAFNESNWDEVLSSDQPVLVDFWAPWCGPCKQLGPVVDSVAADFDGRLVVGKVDVDEAPDLATRYGVQGIPTVLLFCKGEPTRVALGFVPKAHLVRALDDALRHAC